MDMVSHFIQSGAQDNSRFRGSDAFAAKKIDSQLYSLHSVSSDLKQTGPKVGKGAEMKPLPGRYAREDFLIQ
jgi:hypothetical protein